MPPTFIITAASQMLQPGPDGTARVAYTVYNASNAPLRGRAALIPLNPVAGEWVSLAGTAERDFAPSSAQQYTVVVTAPPDTPPGAYGFRLDMYDPARPEATYTDGPPVQFQIPAVMPDSSPETAPEAAPAGALTSSRLPIWIGGALGVVLVLAVAGMLLWGGGNSGDADGAGTVTATLVSAEADTTSEASASGGIVATAVAGTATAESQAAAEQSGGDAEEPTEAPAATLPATNTAPAPNEEGDQQAATAAPTYTSAPTYTPLPTHTAAPSATAPPSATPVPTDTSTAVPTATSTATQVPTATPTEDAAASMPMAMFLGEWENIDPQSGMTRLLISKVNQQAVAMNGYGKCTPTDCDWGVVLAPYTPPQLVAVQDVGYKTRTMAVHRMGDKLVVDVVNDYTEADGREDTERQYILERTDVLAPLPTFDLPLPTLQIPPTEEPGLIVTPLPFVTPLAPQGMPTPILRVTLVPPGP